MNKIRFAVGLIFALTAAALILTAAALVFFVGTEKLGFWPIVLGIIGIGLIGASGIIFMAPASGERGTEK